MSDTPSAKLTRRGFLRSVGLLSGGLAASATPLARGADTPALRVGLLLPRPESDPGLGERLLAGVRLGIREASRTGPELRLDLVRDSVAGTPSALASAAGRMLERDRPDILVALVGTAALEGLIPLLEKHRLPLLGLTAGTDQPGEIRPHPLVFLNSLGMWEACWALGQWSAGRLGQRAMLACSFYESGFDHPEAFRLGFAEAGGTVMEQRVFDVPGRPDTLGSFLEAVERERPGLVAACCSGEPAAHFALRWQRSGLSGQVPLVGSAGLVEEPPAGRAAALSSGAWSALSWSPALDLPENRSFVNQYVASEHHLPDAFAVLGFETGVALSRAWAEARGAWPVPESLRAALARSSFQSPRGRWSFDPTTRISRTPLYLRRGHGSDTRGHSVEAELPVPGMSAERLAVLRPGPRTGWIDTYLCV